MQDLINWQPFNTETKSSYTFNQFIDVVKTLDNDTSPDVWVKWKNYSNQVVIETPNYYYKMYQNDLQAGTFLVEIREALGKIYRENFGIIWNIKNIIKDNIIYTIEQREKLEVCNENNIDYNDMFLQWSKTLQLLEKNLIFPEICEQLKGKIKDIYYLKLIRDCVNKYDDYALTKDGHVVLLDDADWFISIVDKDGNWLSPKFDYYKIITLTGEHIFAPQEFFERNILNHINEPVNKWHIFLNNEKHKPQPLDFFNQREKMLANNIKLFTTGKLLSPKETLYITYDD